MQTLLKLNQKDGFDCPSCAWPDPDGERKTAEFCENGAKAVASEATTKRLTPEVFRRHSIPEMLRQPDFQLEEMGRITHPMLRRKGADYYEPIAWDDAFQLTARIGASSKRAGHYCRDCHGHAGQLNNSRLAEPDR